MREFASDDSYEKTILANIKDVDKKLNNILKAIEMGVINDTTQARMQELEERKRLLNDELAVERNRQKYALKPEHVVRYLECFVGNLTEPSLRDKVLAYLIEKIYIYNDKIVINFYYSEDNREINLQEFKEYLKNLDKIMEHIDGEKSFESYKKRNDSLGKNILREYGLIDDESF